MKKRPVIIILLCTLGVFIATYQAVDGKKNVVIPNAALIVASPSPVETAAGEKSMPEVVEKAAEQPPAPAVQEQETVSHQQHVPAVDYFNLGISLFNEGMYEQAIAAFHQVLLITPGYGDAHYNIALCYLALGNGDAALGQYQILNALDPKLAEGLHRQITYTAMPEMDKEFAVQVGAFKNQAYAEAMIEKLKRKYSHAYIEKTERYNKVRIGGIKSKAEGSRMMLDLEQELQIKPYLIKLK